MYEAIKLSELSPQTSVSSMFRIVQHKFFVMSIRPNSIDLLFLRFSCTFTIKKSWGKIGNQKITFERLIIFLKHFFFYLKTIIMHHLVKLTDAIWLLHLAISSLSFRHWVARVKPPLKFEPRSPDWEVDDLPTILIFFACFSFYFYLYPCH